MNEAEVLGLLEPHRDERAVANWAKRYPNAKLRSVGVALTRGNSGGP